MSVEAENIKNVDKSGVSASDIDSTDESGANIDMAQMETTLFYQDAPLVGPEWAQAAAQMRSNFLQRIAGTSEWTIGNGVGSLSQMTVQERAEKEDEEALDAFQESVEFVEREQERQREREEWSRSMHSYAGMEMTGEEWGAFADELKGDTQLRKWLLEKLKKDGKTEDQAKTMADQMALLAKMQSLPESQWTPEMKAFNSKLDADPALRAELNKDLKDAKAAGAGLQENGQKIEAVAQTTKADTVESSSAKADILAQSSGAAVSATPKSFASTLDNPAIVSGIDLAEHHKAALAAKEPLDTPKQVAAFTPPPTPTSPGAGFDA